MPRSDTHAVSAAEPVPRTTPPPFPGFRSPNYTPVPDELFDELLVELSGAELKALLYIIRRTFGFKRESDTISLSQMLGGIQTRDGRILDRGVGLSKKTLLLALRSLEDQGIILTERRQSAEKGNEPTAYQLNVLTTHAWPGLPEPEPDPDPVAPPPVSRYGSLGEKSTPPLGEKVPQGGGEETPPSPRGKNYTTQNREQQETVEGHRVEQDTDPSTRFELFASMRQNRERYAFSKEAPSGASSRHADFTPPASASDMTAVGEIVRRRRQPAVTSDAADDGHAPERPKTPRRKAARIEHEQTPRTAANPPSRPASGVQKPLQDPTLVDPVQFSTLTSAGASARSGQEGLGRDQNRPRREPPPRLSPYLEDLVTRYSEEFHDDDHIPQNLGQAGRLWQASGWSEAAFGQALHEAKTITAKRDIKKRAIVGGEYGTRNKMPYYFKVLRDLLGLKDREDTRQKTGT